MIFDKVMKRIETERIKDLKKDLEIQTTTASRWKERCEKAVREKESLKDELKAKKDYCDFLLEHFSATGLRRGPSGYDPSDDWLGMRGYPLSISSAEISAVGMEIDGIMHEAVKAQMKGAYFELDIAELSGKKKTYRHFFKRLAEERGRY